MNGAGLRAGPAHHGLGSHSDPRERPGGGGGGGGSSRSSRKERPEHGHPAPPGAQFAASCEAAGSLAPSVRSSALALLSWATLGGGIQLWSPTSASKVQDFHGLRRN